MQYTSFYVLGWVKLSAFTHQGEIHQLWQVETSPSPSFFFPCESTIVWTVQWVKDFSLITTLFQSHLQWYYYFPVLILLIWFKAGCKMLKSTHPRAGNRIKRRIKGRLSAASCVISWAASASGTVIMEAAVAPNPAAPMSPLLDFILLSWLRPGCRMLKRTHPRAGRRIPRSTNPLGSLSAIVAISCTKKGNNLVLHGFKYPWKQIMRITVR